ncbi:MAG: hypothetical protein H8M99_15485 [Gloeobacteraceae cyanobacterium ES-bin-144]|nr:hypothetical protein [Verrucomicrobiales bacterium]
MKHNHSPSGSRLLCAMLFTISIITPVFAANDIPTGTLNVDRTMVRVGTKSNLNWDIKYPTARLVDVDLKPTKKVTMRVRTLGVAFQSGSTLLPLEGSWSRNNGAYSTFFTGTGPSVVPTRVLVETVINKGDTVKFRGRGASSPNPSSSQWFSYHETGGTDKYVIVLKHGDSAPSYAPAYDQASAKSFLAPYIDGSGKIKIGPQDLIILWEASTAAPGTTYFDMQDLVVLVTFEEKI